MLGKSSQAREIFALEFEKEKWLKNETTFTLPFKFYFWIFYWTA